MVRGGACCVVEREGPMELLDEVAMRDSWTSSGVLFTPRFSALAKIRRSAEQFWEPPWCSLAWYTQELGGTWFKYERMSKVPAMMEP